MSIFVLMHYYMISFIAILCMSMIFFLTVKGGVSTINFKSFNFFCFFFSGNKVPQKLIVWTRDHFYVEGLLTNFKRFSFSSLQSSLPLIAWVLVSSQKFNKTRKKTYLSCQARLQQSALFNLIINEPLYWQVNF